MDVETLHLLKQISRPSRHESWCDAPGTFVVDPVLATCEACKMAQAEAWKKAGYQPLMPTAL